MPKVIKRFSVRRRESKFLLREFSRVLGVDSEKIFGVKPRIEIVNLKRNKTVYLINGEPLIATYEDLIFPTLFFKVYVNQLPKVTVDMGAVPHICNGADVMAPGIVRLEGDFEEKSFVVVIDERNRRSIAVAQSIFDSDKTRTIKEGKVFRTLHYVGDDIWNWIKNLPRVLEK